MDETLLNDLLECSICLETIKDSKVLPCQHTFCRSCLEVIVNSHKDRPLRCPECRIKVDIKVEDLPPNVLLMRIIEGMKTANHQNANLSKSVKTSLNQQQSSVTATSTTSFLGGAKVAQQQQNNVPQFGQHTTGSNINNLIGNINNSSPQQQQQPPPFVHPRIQPNPQQQISQNSGAILSLSHIKDWRSVPHAKAVYDFSSRETGDLSFKRGDLIILKKRIDHNWSIGECNGSEGAFPINHVQVLVALPTPKCKALYDFQMKPTEEEGCLIFKKGAVIHVIRRVDQNWAEGRLGETIGIFPISFVEMNLLARQLMDASIHKLMPPSVNARTCPQPPVFEQSLSDSSTTTTSTTSPTSGDNTTTSSNSSTAPNSPITSATAVINRKPQSQEQLSNSATPSHQQQSNLVRIRDAKHEKRHSLTALMSSANNMSQHVLTASNRHSAEILGIPDMTSLQINSSSNGQQQPSSSQAEHKSKSHNIQSRTKKLTSGPTATTFVALYPYKPQKPDELELKKGFIYYVTERCQDGWFKGINQRSQKSGVFPGNYVAPVRSRQHGASGNENARKQTQNVTANNSTTSTSSNTKNATNLPLPELPPRNSINTPAAAVPATSNSMWSKNSYVDQLFNRKSQTGTDKPNNGEPSGKSPTSTSVGPSPVAAKEKKDSSAKSLMKKLTNMKRSKSPSNNTFDNPSFEDSSLPGSSSLIQPSNNKQHMSPSSHPVHVRSGSCPSQLLQSLPVEMNGQGGTPLQHAQVSAQYFGSQRVKQKERPSMQTIRHNNIHEPVAAAAGQRGGSISTQHVATANYQLTAMFHRKSQSLDANTMLDGSAASKNKSNERFKCILQYPPNSEYELELKVGDIVFVHKKRENGWYKGTHKVTGKTGLFPASFVEPDV